jgi:RNA polymerase sigma factor (sigma-70 family)
MSVEGAGGDAEAFFLSRLETIDEVIRYVCVSHRLSSDESDDFASHVRLKLIEHDYAILRKFEGRSQFKTFLSIVVERLLLDLRISAWGKWQSSAAARHLGEVAVAFEQLTVRDGFQHEEAREILHARYGERASALEIERIAAALPARVRRRFEPDEALDAVAAPDRAIDDVAADGERQAMADRVSAVLNKVMDGLVERDALILALRYLDGYTVARISEIIGEDHKRLFRVIDKLLRQLRAEFENA